MNKNAYRLVWNRRHGAFQAVPETARAHAGGINSRSRTVQPALASSPRLRPIAQAVLAALLSLGSGAKVLAATYTVSTPADNGAGSLSQAITDANSTPGSDVIDIGNTISLTPAGPLPSISDTTTFTNNNTVTIHRPVN